MENEAINHRECGSVQIGRGTSMTMIKRKMLKHKIISTAKEVASGILIGIAIGAAIALVAALYCRMAGPLF